MAHCNEMKKDDIYECKSCGLEMKVVSECSHAGAAECCDACADESDDCAFSCCGKPMEKK